MAQGFLQSFDSNLEVFSAGTKPAKKVNLLAIKVMAEVEIDISTHVPTSVSAYLNNSWDYLITVCGGANEACPAFVGKVGKRVHIGFDDPSETTGTPEHILDDFRRVRDEIKIQLTNFYITNILGKELPKCECNR